MSVRLDDAAKKRVERAARILKQSAGAFLEKAGDGEARRVLVDWALQKRRESDASFSELASETGLAIEEIMRAAGGSGTEEALETFLGSCRAVAKARGDPDFLRKAEEAVRLVRATAEVA